MCLENRRLSLFHYSLHRDEYLVFAIEVSHKMPSGMTDIYAVCSHPKILALSVVPTTLPLFYFARGLEF